MTLQAHEETRRVLKALHRMQSRTEPLMYDGQIAARALRDLADAVEDGAMIPCEIDGARLYFRPTSIEIKRYKDAVDYANKRRTDAEVERDQALQQWKAFASASL